MQNIHSTPDTVRNKGKDIAFVPAYTINIKTFCTLVGFQFLALSIFRSELLSTFSSHLIGGFSGDGGLYYWLSQHNSRSLFSLPWFNTRAFYPYTETLAWSDNYILPSFLFAAIKSLGLGSVAAYNSVLLLAMLLSGTCMARFCFLLTGNYAASSFAGALFMGASYLSSVLGHPQLQFTFFFPLAAEHIFKFLQDRTLKAPLILGLLITTAFLTTVYYSIFLAFFIATILVAAYCLRPTQFSFYDIRPFITGVVFGCLPLIFFAAPYLDIRETFGKRFLYEPYFFATNALSLFSAPHSSLLFSWTDSWGHEESHFFIGMLPLLLLIPLLVRLKEAKPLRKLGGLVLAAFVITALLSTIAQFRLTELCAALFTYVTLTLTALYLYRLGKLECSLGAHYLTFRSLTALFLAVFSVTFLISLGPLGNPATGDLALGVYRLMYELFPGFNSIRAISRIMVIGVFSLCVLSAFSIKLLIQRHKPRSYWYGIITVFLIAENFSYPLAKESPPPAPIVFEMLRSHAQINDAAIVLPFSGPLKESGEFISWKTFAKIQVSAMNWAEGIDVQLVNGYSGQQTKLMKELPRELVAFPDKRSLRALRSFAGLRYIVFAPTFLDTFSREDFDIRIRYHRDQLKLLQVDAQGNYLFEIIGEMPLDSKFQLSLPSFPPRVLSFQIKGTGKDDALDIFSSRAKEATPLASIKIEPDTEQRWYSLHLPLNADTVRPLRLSFRSKSGVDLVLGQTRVTIDQ